MQSQHQEDKGITPVGIFWDIENCAIPRGMPAFALISLIRKTFIVLDRGCREYEFMIACDVTRLRTDISEDIAKAGGVTLAHVPSSSKNAADEKLREAMKKFVDTHGQLTPILVLISGDIDFVNDLRGYQTRQGCYIIVLHGPSVSSHFSNGGWNEAMPFHLFCCATNSQCVGDEPRSRKKGRKKAQKKIVEVIEEPEKNALQKQKQPQNQDKKGDDACNVVKQKGKPKAKFLPHILPVQNFDEDPPWTPFTDQRSNRMFEELILMVSGLPGRADFRMVKDVLQSIANQVNGRVKYVKNGQGFITFRYWEDFDEAIEIFDEAEILGNLTTARKVNQIPFDSPYSNYDYGYANSGPSLMFSVVHSMDRRQGRRQQNYSPVITLGMPYYYK